MRPVIDLLLRRPVAVTAFYVLVVALAVVAALRLPVALLPGLEYPSLVIWTAYPDAPPERVERRVTERIEEAVAGSAGLVRTTSRSQLGGSLVRIDFGWSTDLDLAALYVRQQLDRMRALLPREAQRSLVLRIDPSARPVLVLGLGAEVGRPPGPGSIDAEPSAQLVELKGVARDTVARRLEQIEGVARVRVTGGYEPEISVIPQPEKMAAHGIDLDQIVRSLSAANVSLAGGTVSHGHLRYAVEVRGELHDRRDVAGTIVSQPQAPAVRLGDVATVRDTVSRRRGLVRLDGQEVLLLLVERRPGANTVATAAAVREALDVQRAELPGLRLDVVVDESVFIESAIAGVLRAVLWGGVLAVLVLFAFLRRIWTLLAVAVTVPLALAITLVLFQLLEVSFNLISLAGLALGIGMLVDNAIVVIENVSRLRDRGLKPRQAALHGASGVALAITASTLTTIAVFLPLGFVEGLAGRLFRDQSLAVVCSLLASLIVALSVVPLIASRDRGAQGPPRDGRFIQVYEAVLERCLRHPARVLVGALVFLAFTVLLAWHLPRQVVPAASEGRVEVELEAATDATLGRLAQRAAVVESTVESWPEVRRVLADLGERDEAWLEIDPRPPYRGHLTLVLDDAEAVEPVLRRLGELALPPDTTLRARAVPSQLESLLSTQTSDLVIDLTGERWHDAEAAARRLVGHLQAQMQLRNVGLDHPEGIPAYRLSLDRGAMLRYGVRPESVGATIEAAARGREATRLVKVDRQVPVRLYAGPVESMDRLLSARVPSATGLLPLDSLVAADLVELPAVLVRHQRRPVVRLSADIAPGGSLDDALDAVGESFEAVLPATVEGRVGGANEAFQSSLRAVATSFLLSVLLVYLILAAQFESLLQPLIILAVVPLSSGGVVLALALTSQSLNLMSLTGCVVLVGIAVNDAIVKVDFINQERRAGRDLEPAIRLAGRHRARPVVMTTLTTALGLLPLALGLGEAASLRTPLAVAIIGGLVVATPLTLSVIPVLYAGLERAKEAWAARRREVSSTNACDPPALEAPVNR